MSAKHRVSIAVALAIIFATVIVFASRSPQPHLTMTIVSLNPKGDFVEGVIGLTNNGGTAIYRGHSKDDPIYSYVHETPAGSWTNGLLWCGMGVSERTLFSNGGVQFKVWFAATNAPTRILVNYKDSRLLDRLLARAPSVVRSKLPPREWHSVEVRVSG